MHIFTTYTLKAKNQSKWGTPREVHSPIVMYNVNCTSRTASITVLTPDNHTSFLVAGLQPYTNYSCCVMTITTLPLQGSSACNYTTTPPDSKLQFHYFQHVNCIVGVSTIKHSYYFLASSQCCSNKTLRSSPQFVCCSVVMVSTSI